MFLTVLLKFFSCETKKFWKYLVIIKSYVKMFVIMAKICLRKKCYNFGLNSDTSLKILYNSFKAINYNMKIFRLLPFNLIEKQAIKQCHGRVRQGRFITNIPSTCGNIFFCSWIMCLKSMLSDRWFCCEVSYMTAEGCSRVRARSASVEKNIPDKRCI